MVAMSAIHALTAELHSGFLTLAFAGIFLTFLCQLAISWEKRMPGTLVRWARSIRGYAEAAGIVGAFLGFIVLFASGYTGYSSQDASTLLQDPIIRNKVMFTIFATILWGAVIVVRLTFKRKLWTSFEMSGLYTLLTLGAYGLTVLVGSMGGHITKGESSIEPILRTVGFDYTKPVEFDAALMTIVALLGIGALIMALVQIRLNNLWRLRPGANDGNLPTWSEPRMIEREENE
ncbi:MAG TPA: hypothetical protein VGK23_08270 [Methanomassiliicoccales archaeon]|jgi:hypothetical protein